MRLRLGKRNSLAALSTEASPLSLGSLMQIWMCDCCRFLLVSLQLLRARCVADVCMTQGDVAADDEDKPSLPSPSAKPFHASMPAATLLS